MTLVKSVAALGCALFLLAGSALAADKHVTTKLTCCQQATAAGKDCRHKCCVAAHAQGKSCSICNPAQQDAKYIKKTKSSGKTTEKAVQK